MELFMDHASLDLIELSLLGRTSEQEECELDEHLLVCDACCALHASLGEEIELVRRSLAGYEEVRALLPVAA